GQVQMLLAVAQTMRRGGTLMVEAGTGTGKSLAYLVPALARAVQHGERVVVATHTHTLQEQLLTKDVPALQAWLPWSFEPCLLKGRANYVSLRRWRRYLAEPCREEEELRFKLKVLLWIHETETGDRSELRLQGREEVLWAHIASDPLDCVGVHCRSEDCFVHRAREEAGQADLVIVNHALLLADSQTDGGLLPPYEHLIVDEAHHLEDAATQGLRSEVEGAGVEALLERLATERPGRTGLLAELLGRPRLDTSSQDLADAEGLAVSARARVTDLFASFAEWLRTRAGEQDGRREDTLRLTQDVRETAEWEQLAQSAGDAATALAALDTHLGRAVSLSREFVAGGSGEQPRNSIEEPDQAVRELEIVRGRLVECESLLREAFLAPDPERVYWLGAPGRNGSLSIRSAPLDVGPVLHDQVFAERRSVVLTSASLAVAGSFEFFRSRTGVTHAAESLAVESPFDYLRQALICLPTDLPGPDDETLEPFLSAIVAEVAGRLGGRTLALFTSHGQLRDVYDALKQRSDLDELLFLGQGVDGQRRQILETFQTRPHGVILGTASFWEGVDLPGDLLSCVVIVRLPFPVPSEPIYAARAERLRDPFAQYALPRAALRLKQGFGRLIRRSDDRGAVVVLDSRIVRRDYGRAFLEALPPASRFQGPIAEVGSRVQRWVEEGV
ncbi:MAG: DEAD/DEAH box helicase, partial [Candidatus Dormibacteraeota bacterium]|nr:DEAD/DEAH box helicase [Candidatus Dormibacteraeota bacterium]